MKLISARRPGTGRCRDGAGKRGGDVVIRLAKAELQAAAIERLAQKG